MDLLTLLLGTLEVLRDMQNEDPYEVKILRDAIAKSMPMGVGDQPNLN